MNFGEALERLKDGHTVQRIGWNGKGMWLMLIGPEDYSVRCVSRTLLPWIGMKTADGSFVPWLASQTDLLANDWQEVPTS